MEKKADKKPSRLLRRLIWLLAIVALAYFIFANLTNNDNTSNNGAEGSISSKANLNQEPRSGPIKTFSGEEFRDLYNSFSYPNSALINEKTPITGDAAADARIRRIAEQRGYRVRSAPVTDAFRNVGGGMLLQEKAAADWLKLKKAAESEKMSLSLTAAYRSAEGQKKLLLSKLGGISANTIRSGRADAQLNDILATTAVPGYSRHHTGYTVDIACDNDPSVVFEASSCFDWLSNNNYIQTKQHGWIPSYPDGAGRQGPDPESWEYVWVGPDALRE